MLRYVPAGIAAGLTSYWTLNSSVVSPNDQPASKAAMFAFMISGLFANFLRKKSIVPSVGRW